MATDLTIGVPHELPVMTLPNVAFFPQALLPLHIFEPRYRRMLADVLASDRLFAVAGLDPAPAVPAGGKEPLHRVASVGIIRACQKSADGTSRLLLQGLCRVRILDIVTDSPYRRIRVRPLASRPGGPAWENLRLRGELCRLLGVKRRLASGPPDPITAFLKTIGDPETFVDIAAYTLCEDPSVKQRLLETLDVRRRLTLFNRRLLSEIQALRLQRRLQGSLPDERVSEN